MKPSPEAGLRWLRQAEHDLKIAQSHQRRRDYSDACFMAEQASQKALKGFLIAQGRRSTLIHSVARLAEECSLSTGTSPFVSLPVESWTNTTFPPAIPMFSHLLLCHLSLTPKNKERRPFRLPKLWSRSYDKRSAAAKKADAIGDQLFSICLCPPLAPLSLRNRLSGDLIRPPDDFGFSIT